MPTVTALKALYQDTIAPNDDDKFLRLLTEADMKLVGSARWRWTRTRVTLTPVDGMIVLPADYASILGAQVGGSAKMVHDEEFEFTADGLGEVEVDGCGGVVLIDQGLNDDGLRHYKVTGHLGAVTVTCLVQYAPVALYDPVIETLSGAVTVTRCPDNSALKLTMLSLIYEETTNPAVARQYMGDAIARLNDLEKAQRGGAKQILNLRPNGTGMRKIRHLR